jgi:hypothetical protein
MFPSNSLTHKLVPLVVTGIFALASVVMALAVRVDLEHTLTIERAIRLLTGNYGVDAALQLVLTGAWTLLPAIAVAGLLKVIGKARFWLSFFESTALLQIVWFVVLVAQQQPLSNLIGVDYGSIGVIRASIGTGFLAAIFSAPTVLHPRLPFWARILAAIGLACPFVLLALIPSSLEVNGFSWAHLGD